MSTRIVRHLADESLKFEYGLAGSRLLPWMGARFPFGGAYCVVAPHSDSTPHVNSPDDEEELFIGIAGRGEVIVGAEVLPFSQGDLVLIPRSVSHYLRNTNNEPLQFYTVWWNRALVESFLASPMRAPEVART